MTDTPLSSMDPGATSGGAASPSGPASLAESELLHRALLDGMLDPVITIDQMGVIQQASRSVSKVFGYTPTELVGKNIKLLMPEPHISQHDEYLTNYRETGHTGIIGTTREFQVVRKSGELRDVELSVNRVDLPGHVAPIFIGSFRDVTEKKRAQRREVSMLKALATLGESTAELVHEIKNPITAVNMALRAVADALGEDQEQILGELVTRMKRLETQMRQSLAFARPLDLKLVPMKARALFEDVGQFLRPMLTKAGVVLDVDVRRDMPRFLADTPRLEEVLSNLVANGMEMLPPGGTVCLSAGRADAETVWLRVADDGPGIASSVRESLFQPFVTTKAEGTGLGLPICRRIVEEHGGSLDAEGSSDLGGACFRILLPINGPPGGGHPNPRAQPEEDT
jgi:two-component system sensor kinase FixL